MVSYRDQIVNLREEIYTLQRKIRSQAGECSSLFDEEEMLYLEITYLVDQAISEGLESSEIEEIKGILAEVKASRQTIPLQKLNQLKDKQAKTANDLLISEQNYKQLNTDYQELRRLQQEILAKVKHLQEDLKKTTIHKEHAEKELAEVRSKLDCTNAILNKPKPVMVEVGTQTDLTAKQITQMELDITKYQQNIQKEKNKVNGLYTKLSNLRQEIKDLQDQTKLNPAEQELSKYGKENKEQLEKRNKELEEKLKEGDLNDKEKELIGHLKEEKDWKIRKKFIQICQSEIEKKEQEQTITDLTKKKNELQTQLDLATKTKEELAEELALEKGWWDKWLNDSDKKRWGDDSANRPNNEEMNFGFLAKKPVPFEPSSDFPGFEKIGVSFSKRDTLI
ncbi:17233_t:CDS:2, partial [Racocetra fulgida]